MALEIRMDEAKVRCDHHSKNLSTLHLIEALEDLCHNRYVKDWTPKKSIFKLFYILCLHELKDSLETIRLLASNAGQVESLCMHFIDERKIAQLTALLMVARGKLMVPSAEGVDGGQKICRVMELISEEFKELGKKMSGSMACSSTNYLTSLLLKHKKISLLAALDVVRALWSALDVLEQYQSFEVAKNYQKYEVPYAIAFSLFKEASLILKPMDVHCDDVECLRVKLNEEAEERLSKALDRQMRFGSSLPTNNVWTVNEDALWFPCSYTMAHAFCIPMFAHKINPPTSINSQVRALHTFPAVNHNYVKPVGDVHKLSRTSQVKPLVLASARICARLLWMIKSFK